MAKKTTCPISRADFQAKAKPITITIGNVPHLAEVKNFSTGSFGWYLNARTTLDVDGTLVPVLINTSLIIVGSKEAEGAPTTTGNSSEEVA
jgi:hypothetical protein